MTTILDEDHDEYQQSLPILSNNQSNLLTDWANEQIAKINVIKDQIKRINDLPDDKLDCLCNYLDDIDYHISVLNNIVSLVIGTYSQQIGDEATNDGWLLQNSFLVKETIKNSNGKKEFCKSLNDGLSEDDGLNEMETGNLLPKKWSLLYALWFHMIMLTDPESIYYSPHIGPDAWSSHLSN